LSRMTFLAAMAGIGVVCQTPLYFLEVNAGEVMRLTPQTMAAVAYVAFFASFLAYVAYNTAMAHAVPAVAGLFHHLHPVFTATLGMIFLGERMGWFHGVGMVLIASGLYMTTTPRLIPVRR